MGARSEGLQKALGAEGDVTLAGLPGSSAAMLLSAVPEIAGKPLIAIADSADDAGYLYHDIAAILGEAAVMFFPSGYKRDIKYGQADPPLQILRTEVLNRWISDNKPAVVVTYPEALAERVADAKAVADHTLTLRAAADCDPQEIIQWLLDNGFTRQDYVYEPGHFARRGSILDIFGYNSELPVRADFFGDEVDSLRLFNIETQLSEKRLESFTVSANVSAQTDGGISLLDYVDTDTLLAIRDYGFLLRRVREIAAETFSASSIVADEGDADALKQVVDPEAFVKRTEQFKKIRYSSAPPLPPLKGGATKSAQASNNTNSLVSPPLGGGARGADGSVITPQGIYHKNFDLIADSFKHFLADGYTIYILSDSEHQFERLRSIFDDRRDDIRFTPVMPTLHEGFADALTRMCVFTDHQIFDRFHKYNLKSDRARSGKLALSLKELSAIEPGDYIVHVDHGVGQFAGLLRTDVGGRMQEMIKLVYAGGDVIFVSIHGLHKLAKYRGKEGIPPKVNKLGTGAWNKMKERTKGKLKDIARDLIRLYAARKEQKGHAFAPDSFMQQELEASFIYEDTPDQLTATQAVKADMESPRPMDRLICGDVGFGKTEVAIRAAFKAAADGKQTAVLVPTTVLAYQHFNTFKDRLKDFPVRVDYLSRARTSKQVKEILKDLAEGKIDILIGTHRIIGKDVKFRDLGLLVIDEEQKFGVAVKEKLKQLKTNVDTLTMSATPIPRTLQFSLMGARDLSNINTPPPNRYPIITSVNSLSDELVAEAVNFELSRNGQVFIINNRIEGLYDLENMIRRVIPDARTIVTHGQMPPDKLEKAIVDFANHDYDVLIATTIIESGIDMPNVNTIMVNNAQNFGLSELHQLRGRVGRSSRKAFCYLLVPPHVPLSPVARKRLQAIESFSDLGSGIHIAMQDLDIRGAGNLLGAEQSGFIADLGYETYQKVLKEAVTELHAEEFPTTNSPIPNPESQFVADCVIESDLELMLPYDYVPQESERIALYQELDSIERSEDLDAFRDRLLDRFGRIPDPAAELLLIPRLRMLARQLGIEKVVLKMGAMYIYFVDESNVAYYQSDEFGRVLRFLQEDPERVRVREKGGRRSFVIADVPTVACATHILHSVTTLPPA